VRRARRGDDVDADRVRDVAMRGVHVVRVALVA